MGLQEIAGYYKNLKLGFEQVGKKCTFIDLRGHSFQYGGDDCPNFLVSMTKTVGSRLQGGIKKVPQMKFREFFTFITLFSIEQLLKVFLFLWALKNYDVFIFGANSTFLFYLDLPILKLFKKKIIYVFHGSDSRPIYLNGSVMRKSNSLSVKKIVFYAKIQKQIIKIIEKYSDARINLPPQAYFHEKNFILGLITGLPFTVDEKTYATKPFKRNNVIRILHAPSNPEVRGTKTIRKIIKNLREKGYKFKYQEVLNKPNSEVLKGIIRTDIIIDEIFSDTPLAGLGTEAAYFGKPTVVSGYYSTTVGKEIPKAYIPPSFFCHPDNLEVTIEKLLKDKEIVEKMGEKAKNFVRKKWSPREVALRFLKIINDKVPKSWFYNPQNLTYLYGYGLSEKRVKSIIQSIIQKDGVKGLSLTDKPKLEDSFLSFVKNEF